MYFPESTMIITTDGLHCQVYSNEHPDEGILVKPKYIPTDKVSCDALPHRFISGRKMNRLNLWIDKNKLKKYIESFANAYPEYIHRSPIYKKSPLFFMIPKKNIAHAYLPRAGLSELMSMPFKDLDAHLTSVVSLVSFLLKSELELSDLGITYSTLMGNYSPYMSDINIVVYGKKKFWELMEFLEKNDHPELRWKTYEEWEKFYRKRNRHIIHKKETYIRNMYRKKSEGFFRNTLFVIFAVETEDDTWFKWGEETYKQVGVAKFEGFVRDNKCSVVRPGSYTVFDSRFLEGDVACKDVEITKVVFHSRDYCMLAYPNEKIEMRGVVEEVTPKTGKKYYRLVLGYFDTYLEPERRDNGYMKIIDD